MSDSFEQKTQRNYRVQNRYDELMREGKHGHYETMFRVVREEVERERERCAQASYVIELLAAAGHVSAEKIEEARALAAAFRADPAGGKQGQP